MPVRKIEYLSIWEVAHRWEGVDPEAAAAGDIHPSVRERLRLLANAVTTAINPYDAHREVIPLERLWFGFPKTKVARGLDKAVHDPSPYRALLHDVYVNQIELMKWCFGMD